MRGAFPRRTRVLAAGSVLILLLAWSVRRCVLTPGEPELPEFHGQFGQDR